MHASKFTTDQLLNSLRHMLPHPDLYTTHIRNIEKELAARKVMIPEWVTASS